MSQAKWLCTKNNENTYLCLLTVICDSCFSALALSVALAVTKLHCKFVNLEINGRMQKASSTKIKKKHNSGLNAVQHQQFSPINQI